MPDDNGNKTHCNHGHKWTEKNSYRCPKGFTYCRQCSLERNRIYRETHRNRVRERSRLHNRKNKERVLENGRRWRKENPDKVRVIDGRRRSRKRGILANYAPWMERYYRRSQENRCFYCGDDIFNGYELEHMVPLARNGSHSWENTCLSCPPCNRRKFTKTASEFMAMGNKYDKSTK